MSDETPDGRGAVPHPDDIDEETIHHCVEAGIAPRLLAAYAPTFPLAVLACTYEYGQMAEQAHDSMRDTDRADYWKGRMDAYAAVRGELMMTLDRYGELTRLPFTTEEFEAMTERVPGHVTGTAPDPEEGD